MAGDFELKPLSSGIGLGTIRASKPKRSQSAPMRSFSKPPESIEGGQSKSPSLAREWTAPDVRHVAKTPARSLEINPSLSGYADAAILSQPQKFRSHPQSDRPGQVAANDGPSQSSKSESRIQTQAARAAFRPSAVGTQLREESKARILMWLARVIVGWGLDVFVVALTMIVCLVFGTLAWRVGSGNPDGSDPLAAATQVINAAIFLGPLGVFGVFAVTFVIYWGLFRVVAGSTIGGALRDS
ncbi:MAG: hypothetical protein NTV34_20250 [Proteobacteria bacterium]|nr:hypothetical protein [Pseudomonadota bacterium]